MVNVKPKSTDNHIEAAWNALFLEIIEVFRVIEGLASLESGAIDWGETKVYEH